MQALQQQLRPYLLLKTIGQAHMAFPGLRFGASSNSCSLSICSRDVFSQGKIKTCFVGEAEPASSASSLLLGALYSRLKLAHHLQVKLRDQLDSSSLTGNLVTTLIQPCEILLTICKWLNIFLPTTCHTLRRRKFGKYSILSGYISCIILGLTCLLTQLSVQQLDC